MIEVLEFNTVQKLNAWLAERHYFDVEDANHKIIPVGLTAEDGVPFVMYVVLHWKSG